MAYPSYVNSPGAGPHSLASLVQPRPPIPIPDLPPGRKPPMPRPKPPALTDAQVAQQQVATIFDPLVKQITDAMNQRAANARTNITGYTGELGRLMGQYGPQAQAALDHERQAQTGINTGLASSLAAAGQSVGAGLADRLKASGIDAGLASDLANAQGAIGAGSAAASNGIGSADLTRLVSQAANAADYGAKLPGIAGLYGLQNIKQSEAQTSKDLADQLSQLSAKEPDAVQTALAGIQTSHANAAKQSQIDKQQNIERALTIWQTTGKLPAWGAKLIGVPAGTPTASFTHEKATDKSKTDALTRPDPSLSKDRGYLVDANGNPVGGKVQPLPGYHVDPKTGSVIKDAKPPQPAKPPKPQSTSDLARLSKLAEDLRYGVAPKQQYNSQTQKWMDVPNTGTPNSSYTEAYAQLVAQGANPKWARSTVNRLYKPGEFGRPKSAAQKRTPGFVRDYTPGFVPPSLGGT